MQKLDLIKAEPPSRVETKLRRKSVFPDKTEKPQSADEEYTIFPIDATLRSVTDIWANKLLDDVAIDKRGRRRVPLVKFVREYFLRQVRQGCSADLGPRLTRGTAKDMFAGGSCAAGGAAAKA